MEIRNIWTKEQVANYLKGIQVTVELDPDYIYDVYEMANEFIGIVDQENAQIEVKEINQFELLLYCVGEYYYSISHLNAEELARFKANEEYPSSMASVAADKYLSLSIFNHVEKKLSNRFIPSASSLNIYLNFMLNIVKGYKKNDPQSSLISDLLMKSLTISRCILENLLNGYETEAFSSWRTLHECE